MRVDLAFRQGDGGHSPHVAGPEVAWVLRELALVLHRLCLSRGVLDPDTSPPPRRRVMPGPPDTYKSPITP